MLRKGQGDRQAAIDCILRYCTIYMHVHTSFFPPAHDFTGQWSDVTSPGVTVDLTPPTGPTHFHLVNSDGSYSDIPFVVDTESGISGMELGLGSSPGSSDLMEWTGVDIGDGIGTFFELAGISDGQLVFASLQVRM